MLATISTLNPTTTLFRFTKAIGLLKNDFAMPFTPYSLNLST